MEVFSWMASLIVVQDSKWEESIVLKGGHKGVDFWKLEFNGPFGFEFDSLSVSSKNIESHLGISFFIHFSISLFDYFEHKMIS
jgi:hypothetical protein